MPEISRGCSAHWAAQGKELVNMLFRIASGAEHSGGNHGHLQPSFGAARASDSQWPGSVEGFLHYVRKLPHAQPHLQNTAVCGVFHR